MGQNLLLNNEAQLYLLHQLLFDFFKNQGATEKLVSQRFKGFSALLIIVFRHQLNGKENQIFLQYLKEAAKSKKMHSSRIFFHH